MSGKRWLSVGNSGKKATAYIMLERNSPLRFDEWVCFFFFLCLWGRNSVGTITPVNSGESAVVGTKPDGYRYSAPVIRRHIEMVRWGVILSRAHHSLRSRESYTSAILFGVKVGDFHPPFTHIVGLFKKNCIASHYHIFTRGLCAIHTYLFDGMWTIKTIIPEKK